MKQRHLLTIFLVLFLFACKPENPATVTIVDNGYIGTIQTDNRVPSDMITQAGLVLDVNDRILINGRQVPPDQPVDDSPITLEIRRAVNLTIDTPGEGRQKIRTSAFTIGEALNDAFFVLSNGNSTSSSTISPVTDGMTFSIDAPRVLNVEMDDRDIAIQSSEKTIGRALSEAGIPLNGLDYSIPSENEALPVDGRIKIVRVSEAVVLTQNLIPFESAFVPAQDVPLDQTQILSPGETGLSVQRIRIRYEDGREIFRTKEEEMAVRTPKTRTLGYGTKIEIKTTTVDGVTIEYWRAVQMYATSYSPCRSGTDRCYTGTSSGKSLAKGMVALRYSWYLSMGGQPLYIPGYGFATVEDVCGGCVGRPWIDLGYSDENWEQWSSWVTVYFLTPVPQNIVYVLE